MVIMAHKRQTIIIKQHSSCELWGSHGGDYGVSFSGTWSHVVWYKSNGNSEEHAAPYSGLKRMRASIHQERVWRFNADLLGTCLVGSSKRYFNNNNVFRLLMHCALNITVVAIPSNAVQDVPKIQWTLFGFLYSSGYMRQRENGNEDSIKHTVNKCSNWTSEQLNKFWGYVAVCVQLYCRWSYV
jgi:hypothetical protein